MRKRLILPTLLLAMLGAASPALADDTEALKAAASKLLAAPAGQTEESTVKITRGGETIVGTLELPKGVAKPPVVLLLHGFTGSRDELAIKDTKEGVFSRTARLLGERGVATLRIDFSGSGESSGKWEDVTATSEIADALAAFDWLKASDSVDTSRIHVLGWSLGGLVAAHVAAERPVASATLWAAVDSPAFNFAHFLGSEAVMKAIDDPDASKVVEITLPWGAKTSLKTGFFKSLVTVDPVAAIARYAGPLFVIVGTKDTVVTPQPAAGEIFLTYHEGPEKIMILPTDHGFDAFTGPATVDTMAAASLAAIEGL